MYRRRFDFVANIYDSMNNNNNTSAVYIDLKKAFHLINHELLLDQLLEL